MHCLFLSLCQSIFISYLPLSTLSKVLPSAFEFELPPFEVLLFELLLKLLIIFNVYLVTNAPKDIIHFNFVNFALEICFCYHKKKISYVFLKLREIVKLTLFSLNNNCIQTNTCLIIHLY